MSAQRSVTLITGASAGIGLALAREFAKRGHGLFLTARRRDRLEAIAAEIAAEGYARPDIFVADLAEPGAVDKIREAIAVRGLDVEYVVNNAGFGLLGRAAVRDRHLQLEMIDVNVRALTDLSLAFLDNLQRNKGGILNIASVASFIPGPGMAVYYATKAYVLSFSEALHKELQPKGVRVTALCPGPVRTEFQLRAGIRDGKITRLLERTPEQVADDGYRALMAGRRVAVPGFFNWLVSFLPRVLPRAVVLRFTEIRQQTRRIVERSAQRS
jgi:short-subunit dehydrogenase